jgi:hypothetical protein
MSSNIRHSVLAGMVMFGASFLINHAFPRLGIPPGKTLWDELMIAILTFAGLFLLLRHNDLTRELRRRQQHAESIAQLNHHIRNALQVILSRADLALHDLPEMKEINTAVNRIEWALRELLPRVIREAEEGKADSASAESKRSLSGEGSSF